MPDIVTVTVAFPEVAIQTVQVTSAPLVSSVVVTTGAAALQELLAWKASLTTAEVVTVN